MVRSSVYIVCPYKTPTSYFVFTLLHVSGVELTNRGIMVRIIEPGGLALSFRLDNRFNFTLCGQPRRPRNYVIVPSKKGSVNVKARASMHSVKILAWQRSVSSA